MAAPVVGVERAVLDGVRVVAVDDVVVVGVGLVGGTGSVVAACGAELPEHATRRSAPASNHERRTGPGYGPPPV